MKDEGAELPNGSKQTAAGGVCLCRRKEGRKEGRKEAMISPKKKDSPYKVCMGGRGRDRHTHTHRHTYTHETDGTRHASRRQEAPRSTP